MNPLSCRKINDNNDSMTFLSTIILAAGKGQRMHSDLPKVLHRVAGKPLLQHVLNTANELSTKDLFVVYGHGGEQVKSTIQQDGIYWVEQAQQLGTGHAVAQVIEQLDSDHQVLILYGDIPLISANTLSKLVTAAEVSGFSLLTTKLAEPKGYGRIVRDSRGYILRIVEEKDADDEEKAIDEVNTGMMVVSAKKLKQYIAGLSNNNKQNEYYLTDIVEMAVTEGVNIETVLTNSTAEVQGINNRKQLAEAERNFQRLEADKLMELGATLIDPNRFDIRGEIKIGRDIQIDINAVFEGEVELGNRVTIGENCIIKNARIDDDVTIKSHSVIEDAVIGKSCQIGPYARIRPGVELADDVHIGNFVEIKKSKISDGSKVNHLSYIGDAEVGANVNIGAGSITCNYDGANKHKTIIEDNVFIGSDTQLIAPVKVARGATVAAGTTISKDVPEASLGISRSNQKHIPNWKRPTKEK